MSNNKGIFEPQEGFAAPPKSPFATEETPNNPFASSSQGGQGAPKSPFAVADDSAGSRPTPPASPFAAAPESKQSASPFGGGSPAASPFSAESSAAASPFGMPSKPAESASPFGKAVEEAPAKSATSSPFGHPVAEPKKEEPAPQPKPEPKYEAAPAPAPPGSASISESAGIRQLELRAIFGVDRELNEGEILQRSRSLPGIRQLARVAASEMGAIDGIKRVLSSIGFGDGQVKLYCGSSPVEFVREGNVLLAVQTDGGFAPGVRETLMIVARELNRM
ncbi:hypothetical protein [Haloferula sargassicola]|uniref:Roadblock/LAMTOR2 domain-containing protein n=1 Tax=Haloferula sargassicola TaxID=490096 RepID=A0ABP9URQ7_9BACT